MTTDQSIEAQLKELRAITYKNKETSERLETNWDQDRKDFAQFETRLGHLEGEVRTLRELVLNLPSSIANRIGKITNEVMKEVNDFKDVMADKKVVAIDRLEAKKQTRKWWEFWKLLIKK